MEVVSKMGQCGSLLDRTPSSISGQSRIVSREPESWRSCRVAPDAYGSGMAFGSLSEEVKVSPDCHVTDTQGLQKIQAPCQSRRCADSNLSDTIVLRNVLQFDLVT